MAKINTLNYQTVAAWNGSQDLFVVEQPDGTKVATPAQIKQYVLGNSIDDIYSVMGQMGAKNLFNSQYSAPRTNANTTAALGEDGHVIINGTANADAAQLNRPGKTIKPIKDLKVGDKLILSYKVISGTFTHGSSSNATTLYFNNKNGSAVDPIKFPLSLSAGDGDSKEIELTNECFTDGILDLKDIQIYMRSGDTFNNLELAIMLRLASDTDDTYQPYAKTNRQLTEAIGDLSQTGLTGDSVAAQLGTLETTKIECGVYTSPVRTVQSKQHDAITFSANFPSTVFAATIMNTPNAAYVFANVVEITPTKVQVGVYNDYTSSLSGAFKIIYFYK